MVNDKDFFAQKMAEESFFAFRSVLICENNS